MAIHFYTTLVASFLEMTLFALVWCVILYDLNKEWKSKWMSCLGGSFASNLAVALLALIFLVVGGELPNPRRLLLEVSKNGDP